MLISSEVFVKYSMDLNLFFMRIMKEHLIFIEASLPQKNVNIIKEIEVLKNDATRHLEDIISLANGLVSKEAMDSGEFITKYTLPAEGKTEYYTGIHIDGRITMKEQKLMPNAGQMLTPAIVQNVIMVNKKSNDIVMSILALKEKLYEDVLKCLVYTSNYPHLLDHVIREAKFYLAMLLRLQNWNIIDSEEELLEQELFWNNILKEHAEFIRGGLDPTETALFDKANNLVHTFTALVKEGEEVKAQASSLEQLTSKSIEDTTEIKEFNTSGVQGILDCKVKTILLPLLADHTLRETNHYLRILNEYKGL